MRDWERALDNRKLSDLANLAYGPWLSDMADWRYFITLTHRRPTSTRASYAPYSRVGLVRHNRMVRSWFFEDVRVVDPSAGLWGETESHLAGGFHEHLLLACARATGVYALLAAWFDRKDGGFWDVSTFDGPGRSAELAARYLEKAGKYASKISSQPPKVWGLGLHAKESHSLVLLPSSRSKPIPSL